MALAFGSIFNLLVRRFVGVHEKEGLGLVGRVKAKVAAVVVKVMARVKGEGEEKEKVA